tara:strand:+ start:393780 stop:394664 length:885 start_codon:yes stop_codon:yes gene_type:complete
MSLILDALNRSRQDSEQVPGLASQHAVDSVPPGSERGIGWLQWLLVAGLALAVLVIGWLLFDRTPPSIEISEGGGGALPAEAIAPAAVTLTAPAVPATRQTVTAEPQVSTVQRGQVTAAPAVTESPRRNRPEAEADQTRVVAQSPADDNVAALYRQQGQRAAEPASAARPARALAEVPAGVPEAISAEEEALDIQRLVAEAQAELADAELRDNGVPFLATLSQQTKDTIPTLMYQRHDYSGNPGKSRVMINGKTLHIDGSASGVKVVEILPESVVLDFKGTRFRLRALNSWVNL